ncbi:MAG: hypothetical protein ACRC57_10525 [Sarcina sp.]
MKKYILTELDIKYCKKYKIYHGNLIFFQKFFVFSPDLDLTLLKQKLDSNFSYTVFGIKDVVEKTYKCRFPKLHKKKTSLNTDLPVIVIDEVKYLNQTITFNLLNEKLITCSLIIIPNNIYLKLKFSGYLILGIMEIAWYLVSSYYFIANYPFILILLVFLFIYIVWNYLNKIISKKFIEKIML